MMEKATFNYLIDKEGNKLDSVQINSRLMSTYFVQSGIDCWKYNQPQQC